jgi:hypothetical protein
LVAEKNVLLVDDVFITGARANEARKTLNTARAGKKFIYTLWRVIVDKGLDGWLEKWFGNFGKSK